MMFDLTFFHNVPQDEYDGNLKKSKSFIEIYCTLCTNKNKTNYHFQKLRTFFLYLSFNQFLHYFR